MIHTRISTYFLLIFISLININNIYNYHLYNNYYIQPHNSYYNNISYNKSYKESMKNVDYFIINSIITYTQHKHSLSHGLIYSILPELAIKSIKLYMGMNLFNIGFYKNLTSYEKPEVETKGILTYYPILYSVYIQYGDYFKDKKDSVFIRIGKIDNYHIGENGILGWDYTEEFPIGFITKITYNIIEFELMASKIIELSDNNIAASISYRPIYHFNNQSEYWKNFLTISNTSIITLNISYEVLGFNDLAVKFKYLNMTIGKESKNYKWDISNESIVGVLKKTNFSKLNGSIYLSNIFKFQHYKTNTKKDTKYILQNLKFSSTITLNGGYVYNTILMSNTIYTPNNTRLVSNNAALLNSRLINIISYSVFDECISLYMYNNLGLSYMKNQLYLNIIGMSIMDPLKIVVLKYEYNRTDSTHTPSVNVHQIQILSTTKSMFKLIVLEVGLFKNFLKITSQKQHISNNFIMFFNLIFTI